MFPKLFAKIKHLLYFMATQTTKLLYCALFESDIASIGRYPSLHQHNCLEEKKRENFSPWWSYKELFPINNRTQCSNNFTKSNRRPIRYYNWNLSHNTFECIFLIFILIHDHTLNYRKMLFHNTFYDFYQTSFPHKRFFLSCPWTTEES